MEELFFLDNYSFNLREALFFHSNSPLFSRKELFFLDNYPFDLREALFFYSDSLFFLMEKLFFWTITLSI
mgnify:CR=1 FL=1